MGHKILITGASGFIGSFMVEGALKRGFETWAGIRASSSRRYLSDASIHFIELPYDNREKLKEVLLKCLAEFGGWDYIVHNAGVTQCVDTRDFYKVNYENTRLLIDLLKELGMIPKKFIYMSSLSVFGPGDEVHMTPIRPTDSRKPNTEYGKSKLFTEEYLYSLPDFPFIILRPTGVYGPRDKDYLMLIKTVKSGLDIAVGFKPQIITFIYVKDLVKALYLAIEKAEVRSAFFITDGHNYTSNDYTRLVKKKLGLKHVLSLRIPLFVVAAISYTLGSIMQRMGRSFTLNGDKYKIMKQRNWACDTGDLTEKLGFKADYDLQRGVNESIDWYRNEHWL